MSIKYPFQTHTLHLVTRYSIPRSLITARISIAIDIIGAPLQHVTYSDRCSIVFTPPYCHIQFTILLRNDDVVFTFTRNFAT